MRGACLSTVVLALAVGAAAACGATLVAPVAAAAAADDLRDLPLIVVPATSGGGSDWMVVHLTGDGGYGVTDKGLSRSLAENGLPVVVLNSLDYFWTPRTPDGAGRDLAEILRHYLAAWNKSRVVLIGYSMGADVLPFLVTRLPEDLRSRVGLVVFLGLGSRADFHLHVGGFLGFTSADSPPVRPELERLRGTHMECFYGENDHGSICRDLPADLVQSSEMTGGHRVGGNYGGIVEAILAGIGVQPAP